MNLSPQRFAELSGSILILEGRDPLKGIANDSRRLRRGELFVALRTERDDGARYILDAAARGASAVCVGSTADPFELERLMSNYPACSVLFHEDPFLALSNFTRARSLELQRTGCRIVAVTGSNGKSSTKSMIDTVVHARIRTSSSEGNFNNYLGIPISVARAEDDVELMILELGISRPGEMRSYIAMVRPDIAIVTSIGDAHIEFLKTRERIAEEKTEIFSGMSPARGVAIVDGDSELLLNALAQRSVRKRIRCGLGPENEYRAGEISESLSGVRYTLVREKKRFSVELPLLGESMVRNSLFALATGAELGLSLPEAIDALQYVRPVPRRLALHSLSARAFLIDDSYNASPQSMAAGLAVLSRLAKKERRSTVCILGAMAELGAESVRAHRAIGATLASLQPLATVLVGEEMKEAAAALPSAALFWSKGSSDGEIREGIQWLNRRRGRASVGILVKGSRRTGMDRWADALLREWKE